MKNNTAYNLREREGHTGRKQRYDILDGGMRLVTNIEEASLPLYEQAINAFLGANPGVRLELRNCALYTMGLGATVWVQEHYCLRHSLWASDGANLSPFWAIYDALKRAAEE